LPKEVRPTPPVPIIDLFAGPGGLGEGFSSLRAADGSRLFQLKLSIEMDTHAHRTLELRAFYRQFGDEERPKEYYEYVRNPSKPSRDALFAAYPVEANAAREEAWEYELKSSTARTVKRRVDRALAGAEIWVLIGGPPCQAYSVVGRSRQARNKEAFAKDPRHRLYTRYLRILRDHQPPFFVMENVKGILSSRLGGSSAFARVLEDLEGAGKGYDVYSFVQPVPADGKLSPTDYIIRSEEYGIPQARHRVILFGVRKDRAVAPGILAPFGREVTVEDVISTLPALRSRLSARSSSADSFTAWADVMRRAPALMDGADLLTREKVSTVLSGVSERNEDLLNTRFWAGRSDVGAHAGWYLRDRRLLGVTNHEARSHMPSDIQRYLFCSVFTEVHDRSPVLADFPDPLLPAHVNLSEGVAGVGFADRFRVQRRNHPSTTITSHISKDGHYYIHYDPSQARSLSVREAARLQTFPDDYFFEGNRTQQYHQVGNAVPPLLARQLAEVVAHAIGRESEPGIPK